MATLLFTVKGMHCGSCKNLIEDVTLETPGVLDAVVNPEVHVLTVEHTNEFNVRELMEKIMGLGAGYELKLL